MNIRKGFGTMKKRILKRIKITLFVIGLCDYMLVLNLINIVYKSGLLGKIFVIY